MKFLIDAYLPPALRRIFAAAGHNAIHTIDLPDQNAAKDRDTSSGDCFRIAVSHAR
jgi:predicted nuclease of predicted toxin-antitoxin system